MIFNDGSYYQGMFKDNLMHGKGTFYNKYGSTDGEQDWFKGAVKGDF